MVSTKLPKLLCKYGINNWEYYDEENKYSVQLIDSVKAGFKNKYQSVRNENDLIIIGQISKDHLDIVEDIKEFVRFHGFRIEKHISLLAELERFKHDRQRYKFQSSSYGSSILSDLSNHGFDIDDKWIIWNKFIPIKFLSYNGKLYSVNGDIMLDMGYGVQSFKVLNDRTFKNGVYCIGKHPNRSDSGKFCCEPGTEKLKMNIINLCFIKGVLTYANLNHSYSPSYHYNNLKQFIIEEYKID